MSDTAGPSAHMDAGRTPRVVPLPDSRPDQKFTDSFDEVFRGSGLEIMRTPFRAPQANSVAERFVRTVRSECLDWLLILNNEHLERVLDVFMEHYNQGRPHASLGPGIPAVPLDRLARPNGHQMPDATESSPPPSWRGCTTTIVWNHWRRDTWEGACTESSFCGEQSPGIVIIVVPAVEDGAGN
jgi:hypothetical protein